MTDHQKYSLAIALKEFDVAYLRLTKALDVEDLDVSEGYPFFLLDIEAIRPAVHAWCVNHANSALKQLTEAIRNPACLHCDFFQEKYGGPCETCRHTFTVPYSTALLQLILDKPDENDKDTLCDAYGGILYAKAHEHDDRSKT